MPRSTTFAIQDSGRRDSRRRIFALTLLAGFASQVAVFGGVRYVAATETSSGDKGRIAVEAEGTGIRVEFQDAGDEMFSRGDVLVSADSGATVYLLDVKKQRYSEIDLRALARITGRILKGIPGVFGLEIAAPRVEKLFEVDGPEMLGHATRHARYLLSYEERERLTTLRMNGAAAIHGPPFDSDPANTTLRRILYCDQTSWLPDNLLERGDRMTMAASIESRVPFLDHELAGFVSSLPDRCRVNGLKTKWILREAGRGLIPRSILERPKVGFRVPVNEWFRGPMKDYLRGNLLGADSRTAAYYDRKVLERTVDDHVEGRQNHEKLLWSLLNLEVWHRQYA